MANTDNQILIHSGPDGDVVFDTTENWFYYLTNDGHVNVIGMYRPGCFDLTIDEVNAVSEWLKGLLNGILQNQQTVI